MKNEWSNTNLRSRKRMLRWRSLALGALLFGMQAGAVWAAAPDETEESMLSQQIADADNQFGKQIMAKLVEKGENVFISPYSIATALSMFGHCSSKGGQIEELYEKLGYGELTQEEILEGQQELMSRLRSEYAKGMTEEEQEENGMSTVEIANALYLNDNLEVLPAFDELSGLLAGYEAEVEEKALYTEETVEEINEWVKEKTHDMIDSILSEPMSEDAAMLLMNTVYFKGNWSKAFDESGTEDQTFYGTKQETEIPMMHQEDQFYYTETEEYQIICLPYRDMYQMYVYLPKDEKEYEKWSDAEYLTELAETESDFARTQVKLSMPKFELEYSAPLKETLRELGMKGIFEDELYDRVSDTPLSVSEVLHKTALKNDEEGTEASAVTAMMVATAAAPVPPLKTVEMTIDRPFYFTITHKDLGMNLFEGCVMNLE